MSRYVTAPVRKKDAMSLVTGMPVYTGDLVPAGALRVKLLRSPHARALVEAVDTAAINLFSAYNTYRWAVEYGILNVSAS